MKNVSDDSVRILSVAEPPLQEYLKTELTELERELHELDIQLDRHYDPLETYRGRDWEDLLCYSAMHALSRQPWYIKLFYTRKNRIKKAMKDAEFLLKAVQRSAMDRRHTVVPIREKLLEKYKALAERHKDLREKLSNQ